jgi:hypothetical protein
VFELGFVFRIAEARGSGTMDAVEVQQKAAVQGRTIRSFAYDKRGQLSFNWFANTSNFFELVAGDTRERRANYSQANVKKASPEVNCVTLE